MQLSLGCQQSTETGSIYCAAQSVYVLRPQKVTSDSTAHCTPHSPALHAANCMHHAPASSCCGTPPACQPCSWSAARWGGAASVARSADCTWVGQRAGLESESVQHDKQNTVTSVGSTLSSCAACPACDPLPSPPPQPHQSQCLLPMYTNTQPRHNCQAGQDARNHCQPWAPTHPPAHPCLMRHPPQIVVLPLLLLQV